MNELHDLEITKVAFVEEGANPTARVALFKSDNPFALPETLGQRVQAVIKAESEGVAKSAGTDPRETFTKAFSADENLPMREIACSALSRLPVEEGLDELRKWLDTLSAKDRQQYEAALRRLA